MLMLESTMLTAFDDGTMSLAVRRIAPEMLRLTDELMKQGRLPHRERGITPFGSDSVSARNGMVSRRSQLYTVLYTAKP